MVKEKEAKIGMVESGIPEDNMDTLPDYTGDHISLLDIPVDEKIPGYEVGFIALKVMGQDQKQNWQEAHRKGWTPALASEAPKLAKRFMGPPMPGETVVDDYIKYDDLLMMKIPQVLHKKIMARVEQNAQEMTDKANWSNQTLYNERGFKGFDKSETGYGNIKERSFGE